MNRLERMKSYLPEHFSESPEIIAILEDGDRRFEELNRTMDDVLNQFFVETATWGLDKWEDELEILPTTTDFQTRRNQIISKLTSQTPTNYRAIENEVNRFLRSPTSTVRLIDKRYAFEITIPVQSLLKPKKDIVKVVEEIKPAHLRANIFAEMLIGALLLIDDSYRYPIFYKETGEFVPEKDFSQIDSSPVGVHGDSYRFEIEYQAAERGITQADAHTARLLDDTYSYKEEYLTTGEAELLQKTVMPFEDRAKAIPAAYEFAVEYPECGEYELEGED